MYCLNSTIADSAAHNSQSSGKKGRKWENKYRLVHKYRPLLQFLLGLFPVPIPETSTVLSFRTFRYLNLSRASYTNLIIVSILSKPRSSIYRHKEWTCPKIFLQCFALEQRESKAKQCRNDLGQKN